MGDVTLPGLGQRRRRRRREQRGSLIGAQDSDVEAQRAIVVYGDDAGDLEDRGLVEYRSVPMELVDGTTAYHATCFQGRVYLGALPPTGSPLTGTYLVPAYQRFDPRNEKWETVELVTSTGQNPVSPDDGFGAGCLQVFAVVDGTLVGMPVLDYRNWRISTGGRYPAWVMFDADGETGRLTVDELAALAADAGDALAMWPSLTNSFGETYRYNQSMARGEALPNGWLAGANYFPGAAVDSGIIACLTAQGELVALYQIPDCQLSDGTLLTLAPKFVYVDPSATDLADMRIIVNYDVYESAGGATVRYFCQEFAVDADTATITPVTGLLVTGDADETADLSDYTGQMGGRFGADGTFWANTGLGFAQKPMAAFVKTAGERSYVAQAPASAGWETRGPTRLVPDFELGVLNGAAQLHVAQFEDPVSGGQVVVGHGGRVSPFTADSPLVPRATVLPNGTFVANITGWAAFGASASLAWSSADGGVLAVTAAGTSGVVVQTGATNTYLALPDDAVGQSLWATARIKAMTTGRQTRLRLAFADDDGTVVAAVGEFGPNKNGAVTRDVTSGYKTVTVAAEVPAGATRFKLWVDVGVAETPAAGEVHRVSEAYVGLAPVTHHAPADLQKARLPLSATQTIWPNGGSGTIDAVDDEGRGWLPLTVYEHDGDVVQPAGVPVFLASLDLAALLAG